MGVLRKLANGAPNRRITAGRLAAEWRRSLAARLLRAAAGQIIEACGALVAEGHAGAIAGDADGRDVDDDMLGPTQPVAFF